MSSHIFSLQPGERAAVGWSFSWFFCILSAYYVVRPIRETMGTIAGEKHFDLIFLAVFIGVLLASLLFSALVARVSRNRLVPIVFRFFTLWLIGFSLVIGQTGQPSFWTGCLFFVWVSVFNLFAVSLFWSVLADLFSSDQGKTYSA